MNNLKNIKFYVINLDERKDRWKAMVDQFKRLGVTNYERFSAIKPAVCEIMNHPHIDTNLFWNVKDIKNQCDLKYCIGSAGCKLSHYHLLKYIYGKKNVDNNPYCIILEDDCNIRDEASHILGKSLYYIETQKIDFTLLYLGCNIPPNHNFVVVHENLLKLQIQPIWTTHALLIKKANISCLITALENSKREIDNAYNTLYNRYMVYPMVAYQRPSESDILHTKDHKRNDSCVVARANISVPDTPAYVTDKVEKWKVNKSHARRDYSMIFLSN